MTKCPETDKSWSYFSSYKLLIFEENKVFSKHRSFLKTPITFSGSVLDWNVQKFILHTNLSSILCACEKLMKNKAEKTPKLCPIYMI